MDPTPTLMGIPTEIRFKIIKCLAGNYRKRPQIYTENYIGIRDGGWIEHEPPWQVPKSFKDVISLGKVNQRLHSEVGASFCSKVVVHFEFSPNCRTTRWTRWDIPMHIRGFGMYFSAYKLLSNENTSLRNVTRTLTTITLNIIVNPWTFKTPSRLTTLIHHRLPIKDEHRFFVEAINASPSVRMVSLCGTLEEEAQFVAGTGDIESILQPFERLKTSVKLEIHFHLMTVEYDNDIFYVVRQNEIPLSSDGLLPHESLDYIDWLPHHHQLDPVWDLRPSLFDEWLHFRACLVKTLPLLQSGGMWDLAYRHASICERVDDTYEADFATAILEVWAAHNEKDKIAFDAGREKVANLWDVQSRQRSRVMRQRLTGLEGGEAEAATIGPDSEVGLFKPRMGRAEAPDIGSWTEYAAYTETST